MRKRFDRTLTAFESHHNVFHHTIRETSDITHSSQSNFPFIAYALAKGIIRKVDMGNKTVDTTMTVLTFEQKTVIDVIENDPDLHGIFTYYVKGNRVGLSKADDPVIFAWVWRDSAWQVHTPYCIKHRVRAFTDRHTVVSNSSTGFIHNIKQYVKALGVHELVCLTSSDFITFVNTQSSIINTEYMKAYRSLGLDSTAAPKFLPLFKFLQDRGWMTYTGSLQTAIETFMQANAASSEAIATVFNSYFVFVRPGLQFDVLMQEGCRYGDRSGGTSSGILKLVTYRNDCVPMNTYDLNTLPELLHNRIATLSMLSGATGVDGVGYKISDTLYYIQEVVGGQQ